MKRYDPQSPEANEPGDHPVMGERKGNWKVLTAALLLTAIGLGAVALWFGILV